MIREEPRRFAVLSALRLTAGHAPPGERGEGGEVRRSSRVPKREDDEDGTHRPAGCLSPCPPGQ